MKHFVSLLIMVVLLFGAASPEVNAQCAMCKAAMEKSEGQATFKQRAKGLNTGILYLMSVPYILACVIGYYWYKSSKKERERKDEIYRIIRSKMS